MYDKKSSKTGTTLKYIIIGHYFRANGKSGYSKS